MLKRPVVAVLPSLSDVSCRLRPASLFSSLSAIFSLFTAIALLSPVSAAYAGAVSDVDIYAEQNAEQEKGVEYIRLPEPRTRLPRNERVFTQGLIAEGRELWQSSGLYGRSFVERIDRVSGRVIQRHKLPKQYFAEGIAIVNNTLYVLSWRAGRVWLLNALTLDVRKTLRYHGEGWGLTSDGKRLFMSDGSAVVRVRKPENFHVIREFTVTENGKPVAELNELEWIEGQLWANIWKSDDIVMIDPETGAVRQRIDASTLRLALPKGAGVLNGIAYDPGCHCLWLTGKNWPTLFGYQLQYGKIVP